MNGQKLALKRPNDYTPPPVSLPTPPLSFNMAALGPIGGGILPGVSSMVPDGPGKVFVGGLPSSLGEAEVAQLLEVRRQRSLNARAIIVKSVIDVCYDRAAPARCARTTHPMYGSRLDRCVACTLCETLAA